jgi:hypothetical protein
MSNRAHYTAEEWQAISAAPVAAGLLITLSVASGPVGIATETLAVGNAPTRSGRDDAPEIVMALAETLTREGGRHELPDVPRGDRAQTKVALIGTIRRAVGAVGRQSPGEVEAYKTWLAALAAKASHASKEAGFPGIGGTPESCDEQEAISQLADVLGVNAGPADPRFVARKSRT